MKWIKEITLEDVFYFETEVYKTLLYHYETCIDHILKINYGFETIIESEVEKLNEDITRFRRVINELTLDKTDTFEEEFQDEENHPIIYLNKNSWKTFKLAFKSFKERVIAYEK